MLTLPIEVEFVIRTGTSLDGTFGTHGMGFTSERTSTRVTFVIDDTTLSVIVDRVIGLMCVSMLLVISRTEQELPR